MSTSTKFLVALIAIGWVLALGGSIKNASGGISERSEACLETPEEAFTRAEYQLMVRYILQHSSKPDVAMAQYKAGLYQKYARQYDLPPVLLLAVGRTESNFNHEAESNKGAVGVMQIMPFWIKHLSFVESRDDLFQVEKNIHAGAYILRHYVDMCKSLTNAVTCYHGGPRALTNPRPETLEYTTTVINRYKTMI